MVVLIVLHIAQCAFYLVKILSHSVREVGMRPPNIKIFHFLIKSRPAGVNPLTDF